MRDVRLAHMVAAIANGAAAGLAVLRLYGVAIVLLAAVSLLLIWSLERLRVDLVTGARP